MRSTASLIGRVAFWLSYPLLYFYLRHGERTRVLVRHQDRVLLLKGWYGSGNWMLPGGGLHRGELPLDGAIRELAEETGIRLTSSELQSKGRYEGREGSGMRYWYHLFIVDLDELPELRLQAYEISAAAWQPWHEAAESKDVSLLTREIVKTWFEA